MEYIVEIEHPKMILCKIVKDTEIFEEKFGHHQCFFAVPASPEIISIWFEPWKIKPIVRVDGVLVNYALAQIHQYDHKIDLVLDRQECRTKCTPDRLKDREHVTEW